MVKCMEKAHSGYTNHHLLLLSSGRGVFSLGNSLHVQDQRHTRKDLWVGVPTPGGGSTLEILLGVSHEVRISVGLRIVISGMAKAKTLKGWFCHFWKGE